MKFDYGEVGPTTMFCSLCSGGEGRRICSYATERAGTRRPPPSCLWKSTERRRSSSRLEQLAAKTTDGPADRPAGRLAGSGRRTSVSCGGFTSRWTGQDATRPTDNRTIAQPRGRRKDVTRTRLLYEATAPVDFHLNRTNAKPKLWRRMWQRAPSVGRSVASCERFRRVAWKMEPSRCRRVCLCMCLCVCVCLYVCLVPGRRCWLNDYCTTTTDKNRPWKVRAYTLSFVTYRTRLLPTYVFEPET